MLLPASSRLLLLTLATGLAACGPDAYVLLSLESARTIPGEVTAVDVTTRDRAGTRSFGSQHLEVAVNGGFPLEVLYEPEDGTPRDLRVTVDVLLGDALVTSVEADYSWQAGKTTRVHLPLD